MELLTENETIEFLRLSRSTLQRYRKNGEIRFYKIGIKKIGYDRKDLECFLNLGKSDAKVNTELISVNN